MAVSYNYNMIRSIQIIYIFNVFLDHKEHDISHPISDLCYKGFSQ